MDWRIKKDGCGTLLGGTPHKTKKQAMKDAKDFVSSSKYWNGASIEVIQPKRSAMTVSREVTAPALMMAGQ